MSDETEAVKTLSWRWWFENRETGEITVGQLPNWPLFAIAGAWLVGRLADDDSTVHGLAGGAVTGLWLYWGADEIIRGVNPWRRLVGSAVLIWQLTRF